MNKEDAQERIRISLLSGEVWWRTIALDIKTGVPEAAGLSRKEYCDLQRVTMRSIDERKEATKELKANGFSNRTIADILGIDDATVRSDLGVRGKSRAPSGEGIENVEENLSERGKSRAKDPEPIDLDAVKAEIKAELEAQYEAVLEKVEEEWQAAEEAKLKELDAKQEREHKKWLAEKGKWEKERSEAKKTQDELKKAKDELQALKKAQDELKKVKDELQALKEKLTPKPAPPPSPPPQPSAKPLPTNKPDPLDLQKREDDEKFIEFNSRFSYCTDGIQFAKLDFHWTESRARVVAQLVARLEVAIGSARQWVVTKPQLTVVKEK